MQIRPFYLACLAHASYLLADERTGTAVVVDPQRDVDLYIEEARRLGARIKHVMLTHFHADFVAGHLELRDRCGATVHLGARASADYAFSPLRDGDRLEWGSLGLGVLETPGHTPEGVTLLVYDLDADPKTPKAALTGDTLFIGDVGRPDLMASAGFSSDALAGMLYESLTRKLMALPDDTLVYPAHGAGSACGKSLSNERVSTIGEQKRYNYALKAKSREEFVRLVTADQVEAPAYFAHDADMNRRERATLDAARARALPAAEAEAAARAGAQLLDVRDPADFAGAHWRGALNVGLDGKFATWAGSVLDRERPIVLIADAGREREAVTRLARVGFDRVTGALAGGMEALARRPDLLEETPRLTARALDERLASKEPPLVVDVRSDAERAEGFIAGSVHAPLSKWPGGIPDLPAGRAVAVYCAGGYRSSIAASLLRASGRRDVADLVGGFAAWREEGLPEAKSGA
ncbi:MAG TPA: MBL fold metallo-hydrolase [Elusimicrobiota bacterium]|nr:MBL fold metallo-hydrolase [Elusimicrobiota bacterium]